MINSDQDFYFTIEAAYRARELKVKGSRFIADIFPVSSKSEIDEHLDRIRKEFYDATHHCYAYRLGINAKTIRAADDGEPAGTAGRQILHALTSKDLTDCLLVVSRYYGGVNLGAGGLSRAYAETAQRAIEGSAIKTIYLTDNFIISLHYEEITMVEKLLAAYNTKSFDAEYGEKVTMKVNIKKSLSEKFRKDLTEKFFGKVLLSEN
jgi:uncharacterized YigZ family protein